MSQMNVARKTPVIVVALPLAYQDGMDKYDGVMRYLRETGTDWELKIVRETLGVAPFLRSVQEAVDGVICGTDGRYEGGGRDYCLPTECLDFCRRRRIPIVGLDWPLEEFGRQKFRRCSFLNIDSEKVGSFAAEVLMASGEYAAYGFVGMYPKSAWSRSRGASAGSGTGAAGSSRQ